MTTTQVVNRTVEMVYYEYIKPTLCFNLGFHMPGCRSDCRRRRKAAVETRMRIHTHTDTLNYGVGPCHGPGARARRKTPSSRCCYRKNAMDHICTETRWSFAGMVPYCHCVATSTAFRSGPVSPPPCVLLQYRSYHEVLKFIRIVTANYSMNRLT